MLNKKIKYIKVPKNVKIIFCNKDNILIVIGKNKKKILELTVKTFLYKPTKDQTFIAITLIPISRISNNKIKNLKCTQGQQISSIRKSFLEVSNTMYLRFNLIGIGYRVLLGNVDSNTSNSLTLKLGHSHLIYYSLPKNVKIYSAKYNKFTLFGICGNDITQTKANLRSFRKPEPYKGKGVLYYNEKINLKVGKRV